MMLQRNRSQALVGSPDYDVAVIGGGFFGCSVALHLRRQYHKRAVVLELGDHLLGKASFANQARVHGGYHYPRSLLTGYRSQANYARFVAEFSGCIDAEFENYYAIGRNLSKVTAAQFRGFCARIGAPLEPAPANVRRLFDDNLIEDVFRVRECTFDAVKLRERMTEWLMECGVDIKFYSDVERIESVDQTKLRVHFKNHGQRREIVVREAFNCTYSRLNTILARSALPLIPLKYELAELPLIEVPDWLRRRSVTVMCGPFFSIMPFPSRQIHSLSHVRYTPHCEWHTDDDASLDPLEIVGRYPKKSNFVRMLNDARRYLPYLREVRYIDSLWETKAVLPLSEVDDSRPILCRLHHGLRNFHCIAGAKLDNIYDVITFLDNMAAREFLTA